MKHLLSILLISSIGFTQELEVEGDLKVTGTVESATIDSLNQVIANMQAQIDAMQTSGGLETRIFQLPTYTFISYQSQEEILNLNEITGMDISPALVTFYKVDNFNLNNNEENGSSFDLEVERHYITSSGNDYWTSGCTIAGVELYFNNSLININSQNTCILNEHNRLKLSYGGDHAGGTVTFSLAITAQFPD